MPSSWPGLASSAAIAAATRSASKRAQARTLLGRGEIDHEHAHRPVALRLQDETAFEFERRAKHDREHDRLAEQLGDRQRVIVVAQDGIDRRPEPHDAAAQIERA